MQAAIPARQYLRNRNQHNASGVAPRADRPWQARPLLCPGGRKINLRLYARGLYTRQLNSDRRASFTRARSTTVTTLKNHDPKETPMMIDQNQRVHDSSTKRCAVCDGRFGLIRYHVSRTALCSNKCVERFKARRENDRNWLLRCLSA